MRSFDSRSSSPVASSRGVLALSVLGLALAGCQSLSLPAASVSQLSHPEWTWRDEDPRRLARAEVTFQIPDCAFSDPSIDEQFREAIDQLRMIGTELPRALERGELTSEEYVGFCMYVEFITTSLMEFCLNGGASVRSTSQADLTRVGTLTGMAANELALPTSPASAVTKLNEIRSRWIGGAR
jgi:hypothetical protein